jgi:hypothetical protein
MVQFAFWETVKLRRHDGTDVFDVVRYDYAVRHHADFYSATRDAQDLLCPFEKRIVANVINEGKRDAKTYNSTCQTTFRDPKGAVSHQTETWRTPLEHGCPLLTTCWLRLLT